MPENTYALDRRQFYIGKKRKEFRLDCQFLPLNNGYTLSYCPQLTVITIRTEQKSYVLIGDAIQTLQDESHPANQLSTLNDPQRVESLYTSWAGRWLLIADDEIHPDASALLGCYFQIGKHEIEIASSAGLLVSGATPPSYCLPRSSVGMNFYPLPLSGYAGISKILPTQVLNYATGKLRFRNIEMELPEVSYEETLQKIIELLCTTLRRADNHFGQKLCLALTAGYDSRLLMACMEKANVQYESVTFYHSLMSPSDRSLPASLARIAGKKHRLIKKHTLVNSRGQLYNRHSGFHAFERDKEYMLYQQFDKLEEGNTVLIRGGGFEVGTCSYYRPLPESLISASEIQQRLRINSGQTEAIGNWLDWVKQTPMRKMNWRDRFYIEQRLAGWLSCTEQALDLVNIERFVPANSILLYNYFLSIPEVKRHKKVYEEDMIRMLCPQLLEVPINPPVSTYYRHYRRTKYRIEKLLEKVFP